MSHENEFGNEAQLSVEIVTTPSQYLRSPVDYIDLTQDTPLSSRLRSSGPATRLLSLSTASRRKKIGKRSQQLVPDEVIDLNDSAEDEPSSVRCINDSIRDESVGLTCPVCLEELSSKLKPTATKCGHIFCEACLQNVICRTKRCPSCQARITAKSLLRLQF